MSLSESSVFIIASARVSPLRIFDLPKDRKLGNLNKLRPVVRYLDVLGMISRTKYLFVIYDNCIIIIYVMTFLMEILTVVVLLQAYVSS